MVKFGQTEMLIYLGYLPTWDDQKETVQVPTRNVQRNPFQNHQFQQGGKSGQPFYRLSPFLAAIVKHITLLQTKPYFFVHTCVLFIANGKYQCVISPRKRKNVILVKFWRR